MTNSLQNRDALARAVLSSATDFAIITTDLEGLVTSWNTGAEKLLGWSEAEMLGQSAHRFFTPEDNATGRIDEEMRIAREEGRAQDVRWHLKKDGSRLWASGLMMRFEDDHTHAHIGYLKIVQDRTAEHLLNERARDSQRTERLRHSLGELSDRLREIPYATAMEARLRSAAWPRAGGGRLRGALDRHLQRRPSQASCRAMGPG